MRAKRVSTYQCCYVCRQWGPNRSNYNGATLCVDCEADVLRQMSTLGGPGQRLRRKRSGPDPSQLELPDVVIVAGRTRMPPVIQFAKYEDPRDRGR